MAGGDLSNDIAVNSKGEMRRLLGALRRMQQSLVETVTVVRANAQGMAPASSQIAAGNHDLSGRHEEQVSALEEMAASVGQLGLAVNQNRGQCAPGQPDGDERICRGSSRRRGSHRSV